MLEEQLTKAVIGALYAVHRRLGFGFREYIYALAIERELTERGIKVRREVPVMVYYRGRPLAQQTLDMVVEDRLILEHKSTERLPPTGTSQLFSYLSATTMEVGLLLHFGREPRFYRVIYENRFKAHASQRDHDADE